MRRLLLVIGLISCAGRAGADAQLEMLPTQGAWLEAPASPHSIGEPARTYVSEDQTKRCFLYKGWTARQDRQQAPEDDVSIMKSLGGTADTECVLALDRMWVKTDGAILGIWKDHAILDTGSGPDIRGLKVFDLRQKAGADPLYTSNYAAAKPVQLNDRGVLSFFVPVSDSPATLNCPTENDSTAGVDAETTLDLTTGSAKLTGQKVCDLRQ